MPGKADQAYTAEGGPVCQHRQHLFRTDSETDSGTMRVFTSVYEINECFLPDESQFC